LQTSTSIPPKRATLSSTKLFAPTGVATSAETKASIPSGSSALCIDRFDRPFNTTRPPEFANLQAIAYPRPDVDPVTRILFDS
jgi:hypothetical protein